jgi:hypothetical protein
MLMVNDTVLTRRPPGHPDSSTWRITSAATHASAPPSTIHDMMMYKSLSAMSASRKREKRTGSKPNSPNL